MRTSNGSPRSTGGTNAIDRLPEDVPGFCKIAVLDQVREHDYKLTPGIYVGTEADDEEAEAFDEVMPRMIEELRGLFAESNELQGQILVDLEGLEHAG